VIELAYELTRPDGTCALVGVPSEKVTIYTLPIHFESKRFSDPTLMLARGMLQSSR
jgi:hypothetical protein